MRIHISKGGQNYGPYSIEEARTHLSEGRFSESDLALPEGSKDWKPLGELLVAGADSSAASPVVEQNETDDEIDYEKLKEWEDEFEDFDDDEPTVEEASPPPTVSEPPP
ncbi:uncharacterized protein METZ01_LOCUS512114, partial [marine metagenome]